VNGFAERMSPQPTLQRWRKNIPTIVAFFGLKLAQRLTFDAAGRSHHRQQCLGAGS
jgi:hypothetical protein